MKVFPGAVSNGLNPWFKQREMPEVPKQSFQEWVKTNRK
jgi:L-lactate dehydrogenase complex protein LldF